MSVVRQLRVCAFLFRNEQRIVHCESETRSDIDRKDSEFISDSYYISYSICIYIY